MELYKSALYEGMEIYDLSAKLYIGLQSPVHCEAQEDFFSHLHFN